MIGIMKYILVYTALITTTIWISGCAEVENNTEPLADVNVHPEGILNPADPDFHGNLIRESNWEMSQCLQCHGGDFSGGVSDASCLPCHNAPNGPENCSTCHGSETSPAPPRDLSRNTGSSEPGVGLHQVHLSARTLGRSVTCVECHKVPSTVYQQGHIDSLNQAEVMLNSYPANLVTNEPGTSTYDEELSLFSPDPVYNYEENSCANTYCHGTFKNGNPENIVLWTSPGTAECGTCHGSPDRATLPEKALPKTRAEGGTHPEGLSCNLCHEGVVDEDLKFINLRKHIDGRLNLFGNDVVY